MTERCEKAHSRTTILTRMGDRLWAGKPLRYVICHLGQLSVLHSPGREMSTSQNALMLCGWIVKASMAYSVCGCICDLSLTPVIPVDHAGVSYEVLRQELDGTLFHSCRYNPHHVLHRLLPPTQRCMPQPSSDSPQPNTSY